MATTWNMVFAYGSVALALVRNIALVPVFLHFIDGVEYGAWLATGGVLAYLLMLDFGLMGVVGQRTAEAYGARDYPLLGRRIGTGLSVTIVVMLLSAVLAAAVAPLVPGLMRQTGETAERLVLCFLIVGLANSINLMALATRAVLRSLQRPKVPGLADLGSELAGIALTLVLLMDGRGLYAVAFGLALRGVLNTVGNVVGCFWVCKRIPGLRLRWHSGEALSLWRNSFFQFFTAIATRLQARSDTFFVGWLVGPQAALIYGLTIRAHETVRLVTTHFVASIQPSLSHLDSERNRERFREIVLAMLSVTAAISCIGMSGVIAFNGSFVGLWVGPETYGGLLLTVLVAIFGYVADLGSAQYGTLMAMGQFRRLCRVVWEGTLVRLPLLILLLLLFGMWGAPVAAIAGALVQTLRASGAVAGLLGFARREWRQMGGYLLRGTAPVGLLAAGVVWSGFAPQTWVGLGAGAAAFSVVAILTFGAFNPGMVRRIGRELRSMRGAGGSSA
jgi:O-antigen/teichoic acid export membrane protein